MSDATLSGNTPPNEPASVSEKAPRQLLPAHTTAESIQDEVDALDAYSHFSLPNVTGRIWHEDGLINVSGICLCPSYNGAMCHISPKTVKESKLHTHSVRPAFFHHPGGTGIEFSSVTKFHLNIAGVTIPVLAYVDPIHSGYSILLSSHTLTVFRIKMDFATIPTTIYTRNESGQRVDLKAHAALEEWDQVHWTLKKTPEYFRVLLSEPSLLKRTLPSCAFGVLEANRNKFPLEELAVAEVLEQNLYEIPAEMYRWQRLLDAEWKYGDSEQAAALRESVACMGKALGFVAQQHPHQIREWARKYGCHDLTQRSQDVLDSEMA